MAEENDKKYPSAMPEVAKMMAIAPAEHESATPVAALNLPVANLPIVEVPAGIVPHVVGNEQAGDAAKGSAKITKELEKALNDQPFFFQFFKMAFPYVLVFAVGVFLYFFFFTKIDFSSIIKAPAPKQSVQDTALLSLENQNMGAYNAWIKSFYYDVSDPKVLDPNTDNSGNGLTNFQKFLLNLNPKSYDTLGLGMADSESLSAGINPLSGQNLTDSQKQILDKYFDMETIMNKLALNKMNGSAKSSVLGAQTVNASSTSGDPIPATGAQANPATAISETNALGANNLDINLSVPGRLQIPSLKVDAPLIWSKSPDDFDKDLKNGVIHYPGTAMPGQIGTTYISGHSSNYIWVKSDYNHIFTHLGDLGNNQSFQIAVTLNSGKQVTLHYVVMQSQQFLPSDQAQFANSGKSVVALSTCWPVGSTAKRLVVFGELSQIEQ